MALARRCQGASSATESPGPRSRASAAADSCAAADFSNTIRRCSAAVHRPSAISRVRWLIVCTDDQNVSASISDSESAPADFSRLLRFRRAMSLKWWEASGVQGWCENVSGISEVRRPW